LYTTLLKSLRETQPDLGVASAPVDVQRYVEGSAQVGAELLGELLGLLGEVLGLLGELLGLPGELLGELDGPPVWPLQVVPLRANVDGAVLAPVHAPLNPNDTVAPVPMDALYDMFVAVAAPPDCVTVAFHACVTVWPFGNVHVSRHPLTASPRLVMSTFAPKPPGHELVIV
jgi:hypothetical protein